MEAINIAPEHLDQVVYTKRGWVIGNRWLITRLDSEGLPSLKKIEDDSNEQL